MLCLAGCGKYTMEEAKENGDIIVQKGVENSDRFEFFLNKSKQGKSDQIRITTYTTDKTIVKQEAIYALSKCAEGTDHELLRLPKQ